MSWIGINEAGVRVPAGQLRLLLIAVGLGLQHLLQQSAVGHIAAGRAGQQMGWENRSNNCGTTDRPFTNAPATGRPKSITGVITAVSASAGTAGSKKPWGSTYRLSPEPRSRYPFSTCGTGAPAVAWISNEPRCRRSPGRRVSVWVKPKRRACCTAAAEPITGSSLGKRSKVAGWA